MPFHKITQDDYDKLFRRAPLNYKVIMTIQEKDGLRASEVLNLRLQDLEFDRNLYRLPKQKNGVLMGARYMSKEVKEVIQGYLEYHLDEVKKSGGYLFFSPWKKKKGHIRITSYCQNIRVWSEELGIRHIAKISKNGRKYASNTSHSLRTKCINSYRKKLLEKTGQISDSMVMLKSGHTNKLSLKAYEDNSDELVALAGKIIDTD